MTTETNQDAQIFTERLFDALALLAQAIRYHADVIGYKADADNKGPDGKAIVTLETNCLPSDNGHETAVIGAEEPHVTIEDVKKALKQVVAAKGKKEAERLISLYSDGKGFSSIKTDDYSNIIKEATA